MKYFFYLLCGVFLLSSCHNHHVYEKYVKIPEYVWNETNPVVFQFNIIDTAQLYHVFINIRNASFYPYSNIWLIVEKNDPAGNKINHKKYEFTLADQEGKWLGKGIGDIIDNHFILEENVKFNEKGYYKYIFYQNMRIPDLPGVMDVGIEVEKATK